jgi:hypothetical protein
MDPTSFSLLDRLKVAGPDAADWRRLQAIYLPLIERWLSRIPGPVEEPSDLPPIGRETKAWSGRPQ